MDDTTTSTNTEGTPTDPGIRRGIHLDGKLYCGGKCITQIDFFPGENPVVEGEALPGVSGEMILILNPDDDNELVIQFLDHEAINVEIVDYVRNRQIGVG